MNLHRSVRVALAAVVLLLVLILPTAQAQPGADEAQPAAAQSQAAARLAIANPARIFNDIQETKDLQAKFQADLSALREEGKRKELQINDTRAARDSLKPDTAQWSERNRELIRLAVEYKGWQEMMQAELEGQQKRQMKTIFDRITETIGEVAQQRGIDLVIAEVRPELPERLDEINANDLRARLISRNVLYSTPNVDLSNDVVLAMDAKYKGGAPR